MGKVSGWCGVLAREGGISSGACTESYSVEEGMLPGIPRTGPFGLMKPDGEEAWAAGSGKMCSVVSFRMLWPGAGLPVSSEAGLARQDND